MEVGVGLQGSITESSGLPARNSIATGKASLNATVNVGPLSLEQDVLSHEVLSDGSEVTQFMGGDSEGFELRNLSPSLKPQLKLGLSVGVDSEIGATTSVLADAVGFVEDTITDVDNTIRCKFAGDC